MDTCLRFVMKNAIAFRDFWGPRLMSEPYRHTRYYQMAPALAQSALIEGGRGWGKSMGMQFDILQDCLTHPKEEGLLTSWRRAHLQERMEPLIRWFRNEPFLNLFVPKERGQISVRREPRYEIRLLNGFVLYGASVGDDPMAANIQGPHPQIRYMEEAQFYPRHAFNKFQSAAHEAGTKDRFYGIRDGRRDTPWWDLDRRPAEFPKFCGTRFAVPKLASPYYDTSLQMQDATMLGGVDSSEYQNQVMAEWGEPTYGVWPIEDIRDCLAIDRPMKQFEVTPRTLTSTPTDIVVGQLPSPPPSAKRVIMAVDPAYTESTLIMVFWLDSKGFWVVDWILGIKNKVSHLIQAEIIRKVWQKMGVTVGAIDVTNGDGRAIRNILLDEPRGLKLDNDQLIPVEWKEKVVIGFDLKTDGYGIPMAIGETREDTVLWNSVTYLRSLFHAHKFSIGSCERILDEFMSETQKKLTSGAWSLKVPSHIHVPETFRIFAHALFEQDMLGKRFERHVRGPHFEARPVHSGLMRSKDHLGRSKGAAIHGRRRFFGS